MSSNMYVPTNFKTVPLDLNLLYALSLLLSSHTFMQMMGSKGRNEIQIQ